jgi:uncharacterized protein
VLIYVDSSVLARAYLHDERGHHEARALVEGPAFLVTSSLTVIEVTSALMRATQAGRAADVDVLLERFEFEISSDGPVTLISGDQMMLETTALQIARTYAIRTLDALHLAVADLSARPLAGDDEQLAFASRHDTQREAAAQLGFVLV